MYGGLLKSASALAIVAGVGLFGVSPATAADLGGDCCADLEERVAELEATTARKGTRKVSLTISGQISQELLFWDDGVRSDMYVTGPNSSNSRWRFLGTAKISPEVTAGFLYEMQTYASASSAVNQSHQSANGSVGNGDDLGATNAGIREAMVWIEHSRLGRVSIGHGSNAANNSILVDLSGKGMAASNGVFLHPSAFFIASGGTYIASNTTWGAFFQGSYNEDWLNTRNEHIQYRTPTFAGFSLGTSVGEDNYWDVEGRYSGEFNGVRIAARLAYSVNGEFNRGSSDTSGFTNLTCATNCAKEVEQLAGSLSIRHMPTGLFFTGAAGWRDTSGADVTGGASYDSNFYYLSAGVARNITGLGDTVFYGEYSEWTGVAQSVFGLSAEDVALQHWGVGIVQHVDAAAMEFWLAYKNYSIKNGGDVSAALGDAEDLHSITAGTRIRF